MRINESKDRKYYCIEVLGVSTSQLQQHIPDEVPTISGRDGFSEIKFLGDSVGKEGPYATIHIPADSGNLMYREHAVMMKIIIDLCLQLENSPRQTPGEDNRGDLH